METPSSSVNVKPIIPNDVRVTKASTKGHDVTPKAASRRTKGSSLSSNSKTNVDAKRYFTVLSIENCCNSVSSFSLLKS